MSSATISVPSIHCDHCKASIEGALKQLDGVKAAEVSVPDRSVSVDYDEAAVNEEQIRNAIIEQGYDVPA